MDGNSLVELGQQFGISALLFIIFIVYNNGEQRKWSQREQSQSDLYQSIITQIKETRVNDFKILNDTLADNRIQLGMLKETLTQIEHLSTMSNQAFRDVFGELKQLSNRRCIANKKTEENA